MDSNADHPGAGYCANAVFIVDNFNRIRYHEVMDVKMMHDIDELTRFHNLQRQALTQFIKLYQYMT